MMKLKEQNKILLLGIILLIIAGVVVVLLRGFNVSLNYQQHQSATIMVGKDLNLNDIRQIVNEALGNKKFDVKLVEYFNDSFKINAESITNEEIATIITKLNEKYGVTINAELVEVTTISNIRLRDIVKPYIKPIIITAVIICAYVAIRFRNSNFIKMILRIVGSIIIVEALILSVIAISRIPLSPVIINVLLAVAALDIIYLIEKYQSAGEFYEKL